MDVYALTPINGTAARVTSQSGCNESDELTIAELQSLKELCDRKRRLIKRFLGITNRSKHKNIMYKYNKRGRRSEGHKAPRILDEYVALGVSINRMCEQQAKVRSK